MTNPEKAPETKPRDSKGSRKFRISDALILIVATALASAATRQKWERYFEYFRPGGEAYQMPFIDRMYVARAFLYMISHFVITWSLAGLWMGLRRPRPTIRSIFRRPGMAACLSAMVVLAIQLANFAGAIVSHMTWLPWTSFDDSLLMIEEPPLIPSMIGCAIAATWIVQAAAGRWRPEPHWIDRLGRALGCFWIATIPFSWFSWNL